MKTAELKRCTAALALLNAHLLIKQQTIVTCAYVPISGETDEDETVMTERLNLDEMDTHQLGMLIEQSEEEYTDAWFRNKRQNELLAN